MAPMRGVKVARLAGDRRCASQDHGIYTDGVSLRRVTRSPHRQPEATLPPPLRQPRCDDHMAALGELGDGLRGELGAAFALYLRGELDAAFAFKLRGWLGAWWGE